MRCKSPAARRRAPAHAPAVSLVRPVCGIENHIEETLASAFALDYPRYEIVFCVALAQDPVVPTVRRLMAAHPEIPARLLVGNEKISDNPSSTTSTKAGAAPRTDGSCCRQQCVHAARLYPAPDLRVASRHRPHLLAAGGLPPRRLLGGARMRVSQHLSGPLSVHGRHHRHGLCAKASRCCGGATFSKRPAASALWHPSWRRMRPRPRSCARAGLRVRLVDAPFEQPLGHRSAAEVWRRQVRWARLRRTSFKTYFMPEILAAAPGRWLRRHFAAAQSDLSLACVPALAVLWYGSEAILAWAAGLAPERPLPARLGATRSAAAGDLVQRLARQHLRLARQPDATGRIERHAVAVKPPLARPGPAWCWCCWTNR